MKGKKYIIYNIDLNWYYSRVRIVNKFNRIQKYFRRMKQFKSVTNMILLRVKHLLLNNEIIIYNI